MALGGCLTCIKYLLFIFNFLFWLAGCVLLGLGIWLVVEGKNTGDTGIEMGFKIGGYGLIVVGSIIMIVGFFGCCGAIRESQCLLVTFFICLFILFGIIVGLGVYAAIYSGGLEDINYDLYKKAADKYGTEPAATKTIDDYNSLFKCCGYNLGVGDFVGKSIPPGCVESTIKLRTCPKVMSEGLKKHGIVAAGVALGVAIILLLGMIFSMMLCCAIRDQI